MTAKRRASIRRELPADPAAFVLPAVAWACLLALLVVLGLQADGAPSGPGESPASQQLALLPPSG